MKIINSSNPFLKLQPLVFLRAIVVIGCLQFVSCARMPIQAVELSHALKDEGQRMHEMNVMLVEYVFNEKKHKDNITFENISNTENIFPEETKRLIYVALSRPKHLLAMAFPESITDQELINKFGERIKIVSENEI